MKFDCVIGNPPYQDKAYNSSKALWLQFINKGLELIKDGCAMFLTPTSWVGRITKTVKSNYTAFTDNHIVMYKPLSKTECNTHFNKVGSSFGYYIIKKGTGTTKLYLEDGVVQHKFKTGEPLPTTLTKQSYTLHKKISQCKKYNVQSIFECHGQKLKNNSQVSDVQTELYIYKTHYSHNLIRYTINKSSIYNTPKVLIPQTGTLQNAWYSDQCNITEDVKYIIVKDKEEGEALVNKLNSDLFKYINKEYRPGRNLVAILNFLPIEDVAI